MKTLKQWIKKYYPVPAPKMKRASMLEAVNHSLKKWQGVCKLGDYDVQFVGDREIYSNELDDEYKFSIDASTCALCIKYDPASSLYYRYYREERCKKCPLAIVRGGVPCDETMADETLSPYSMKRTDPSVMVGWLKKAQKYAKDKAKK